VESLLKGLESGNYGFGVQLAELPLQLRGFGHVKDGNREKLAELRTQLMEKFRGENVVQIIEKVA
jgi:indolepyruvate ferredoxin oxidoreductase